MNSHHDWFTADRQLTCIQVFVSYVDGARHTDLPESCWIIDPNVHHFVDVHITINEISDQVSVVMVRNVGKMDPRDDRQQLFDELTERCTGCTAIKLAGGKGTARAKSRWEVCGSAMIDVSKDAHGTWEAAHCVIQKTM